MSLTLSLSLPETKVNENLVIIFLSMDEQKKERELDFAVITWPNDAMQLLFEID
jgi:hypothetical protein